MRRPLRLILIAIATAILCGSAQARQAITAESLTDGHVQKAIDAIIEELHARKHSERLWEPEKIPPGDSTRQRGGYTALVALAMLHAGQSYQDPRLKDAIDYLAMAGMEGTYALTLRASVWAKLPPKYADKLAADVQWLLDGFSDKAGGWDYVQDPRTSRNDNSIRQFGALALWEAAKRGAKVDKRCWQRLEDAYIANQLPDGGWNYTGDGPATGSMTAAGLASLFITQDFLHGQDALKIDARKSARHDDALQRGLKWMDENFSATENPGRNTYFYYYLWGVERVGLASGYKRFGSHDWFREGSAELLRRLCKWDEDAGKFAIHATTAGDGRASKVKVDDLAFALIFLSRGRVPVAINKLELAEGVAWNNRPRDVANLTRWIADNTETQLNWQIVSMDAEPEEWLDAPVLYLASHQPLLWLADGDAVAGGAAAETVKLKRYLDRGGLLLAVNESASKNFAESIERLGGLVYPHLSWRTLPADHWAYKLHAPVKAKAPPLRGLSNGVRELIILAPAGDLPESFQSGDTKRTEHLQTAMNIYFLASELNRPQPRLASGRHGSGAEDNGAASRPEQAAAAVTIVRAAPEGTNPPEPLALPMLADWLATARGMTVSIVDQPLSAIHQLEPAPALVVVSAVEPHTFTRAEVDAIKSFIERPGTAAILFETPGGRGGFTESAEQVATAAFGRPIESLLHSPIITGADRPGSTSLTRVEYRPFTLQTLGTRETTPRLRGMAPLDAGAPRLFFSRDDLSHALLGQPCWGVSGYSTQSARELLTRLLQDRAGP